MRQSNYGGLQFAISLIGYSCFGLSLAYLVGFILDVEALPVTVNRGPDTAWPLALAIDVLLILAFGVQHSVMARPGFKRWLTRHVPGSIERSLYVIVSSAVTAMLCLFWQPLPDMLWSVSSPVARLLWYGSFALGFVTLVAASFHIDHLELFGIRQALAAARGDRTTAPGFVVRGLYRFVRHPIYVGWLMLFWITPDMTVGHLLLAAGMTMYVLIAMVFEERDLVSTLGTEYLAYRTRVPALLPKFSLRRIAGARQSFTRTIILPVVAGMLAGPASDIAHATTAPAFQHLVLDYDGRSRHAVLLVPSADHKPDHLVIMLHGAGGNAQRIRRFTGYSLEQPDFSADWIVVYPEGLGGTWNDCRTTPSYPAIQESVDDVGFLAELILSLRKRYSIPAEDVLIAGFSNGGQMAIRFAIEKPESIGSLAVIAAQLPGESESRCDRDISLTNSLWINGTKDPFVPWEGGPSFGPSGTELGPVRSVPETIRSFLEPYSDIELASTRKLPETDGNPSTWVIEHDWRTEKGIVLRQLVLHGAGHVVPQKSVKLPDIAGPAAGDVVLAEVICSFLNTLSAASIHSPCHLASMPAENRLPMAAENRTPYKGQQPQ